jgi:hypothetical protein
MVMDRRPSSSPFRKDKEADFSPSSKANAIIAGAVGNALDEQVGWSV